MAKHSTNRRSFLKTSAAAVGFWSSRSVMAESRSANEKLNIGVIGAGGKGYSDMNGCKSENIVALCDIDEKQAARARREQPRAKFYFDFREMLDKEKLDAVTVSTPDHTHAFASISAMQRGLHVYCQKPLTHDVSEARQMTLVARKQKVVTQMGNQGTSASGLRRAAEVVQSGAIGNVTEVHIWTNRPGRWWSQGHKRPERVDTVPSNIKWDLVLGTAPKRPYVGGRTYHPFVWRGWWDFGTGALGDMACHTANMPYMALKLGAPTSVSAQFSGGTSESPPVWSTITYQFPKRGDLAPVKFVWYDGDRDGGPNMPPASINPDGKLPRTGAMLIGDAGRLVALNDYGSAFKLLPEGDFKGYKGPPETLPRSPGHYKEWILGCKGGPTPMSNFDYAGPLTEFVLLGNVAMRAGGEIQWDAKNLKVANRPEANQYITRDYRKGWEL